MEQMAAEGQAQDLDAEVVVEKTSDDLRATIQVFPPTGNGRPVTAEMIRSALRNAGVTHGIQELAIGRVVGEQIYYQSVTVAEGTPPVEGQDAQLVYHYTKNQKIGLQEDKYGKVDFREMNKIINCSKGDLLLEKIPAVDGQPGVSISGKKIQQRRGKDIRIRVGKNVRQNAEGTLFYAEQDGQVILRNYMLAVENLYQVEEVDASVGNIRFKGTVRVDKNIKDNYEIHASESVFVGGTVGAATIVAGGNVVIGGGAVGSTITAGGSVQCRFAQEAKITAKGDVVVEAYTKHCEIRSNEQVTLTSDHREHGSIIGGYTSARKGVTANNLGSEAEVPTEVRVGLDPEAVDKLHRLAREVEGGVERFGGAVKNLLLLQKAKEQGQVLEPRKAEMLRKMLQAARLLRDQVVEQIPELIQRSQATIVDEKGKVNVLNHTYPNVTIHIHSATLANKTMKTNCSFVLLDGEVTMINLRRD